MGALGRLTFLQLGLTQGRGKILLEVMVLMKQDMLVVGGSTAKAPLSSSSHPLNNDFFQAILGTMEVFETRLELYLKVPQVILLVFSSAPHHRRIMGMLTALRIFCYHGYI